MKRLSISLALAAAQLTLFNIPRVAYSQFNQEGYDDFGNFATDPVDLDNETSAMFGRFFQTNFHLGTGIHTGEIGKAYAAGFLVGLKFIFYFDRVFAAELGAGYGQNIGFYNNLITNPDQNQNILDIEISTRMNLIPLYLGLRYAFNQDTLTRGFSMMNPYISANGEIIFRNEVVQGNSVVAGLDPSLQADFSAGGISAASALGVNFGGGFEFDVYRKKIFMGIDLRYHILMWSNSNQFFGALGRGGNYLSVLGTVSYSY